MSSDNNMELSRRKILGSIGAVGAAGAGAGLGTSALFSDTEEFANNQLTAGELDLKMDWEEHYSFPQIYDGLDDPTNDGDLNVQREDPGSGYIGLPDPTDPVVWVNEDDFTEYFQNTIVEAFPDDATDSEISSTFGSRQPCTFLADVPADLGDYNEDTSGNPNGSPARTRNGDTYDSTDGALSLINLADVKPGDFGELTISTHLCYNDGYLWLEMPGGLTESGGATPESEEFGNDGTDDGELAENIETALWYDDDCSNTINGEPEPLDALAVIDKSGSITADNIDAIGKAADKLVDLLPSDGSVHAGAMTFSSKEAPGGGDGNIVYDLPIEELDGSSTIETTNIADELPDEGSGNTPMPHAIDLAQKVLEKDGRSGVRKVILLLSDGQPRYFSDVSYDLKQTGGTSVSGISGSGTFASGSQSTRNQETIDEARTIDTDSSVSPSNVGDYTIRTVGLDPNNTSPLNQFLIDLATDGANGWYNSDMQGDLIDAANDIAQDLNATAGEKVIFRGKLTDLADELTGNGIPLDGNRLTGGSFDELNDRADSDSRNCFDATSTDCFGFAWWVPTMVGNEIQGDTVSFDLQFYAQQCRNNDGSRA